MSQPSSWDKIAGNWKQLMGEARLQWGKLTDDQWQQIAGNRDKLIGKIQETYGITREAASRQVEEWERNVRA